MAVSRKGNTSRMKTVGDGAVSVSGKRTTATEVEIGPYDQLRHNVPAYGKSRTAHGVEGRVSGAELEPLKGEMARLTVRVSRGGSSSGSSSGPSSRPAEETERFSVEMAQVEKPLLTHKRYRDVAEAVAMWRDEPNAALRKAWKYTDEYGEEQTLSQLGQEAAGKIMKGVESYLVWAPVIRRSTAGLRHATVGRGMGKIESGTPNIDGIYVAGSWKWLKTGDSAETYWTQDDNGDDVERCSREELWTGADDWDEDLYG